MTQSEKVRQVGQFNLQFKLELIFLAFVYGERRIKIVSFHSQSTS